MKTYHKKEFQLIESDSGAIFAAIGSDDLFKKMNEEIEAGEAELI